MRIFIVIITLLFTNVSFGKIHGTSQPFCDGKEKANLKEARYLKLKGIEINPVNQAKWVLKNHGLSTKKAIHPNQIKYHKARIKVLFENETCTFKGKVKLHGTSPQHRSFDKSLSKISSFKSSLRVKLEDGHINNQTNFILFLPGSRNHESEVFVSNFFRAFGFLSPETFRIKLKLLQNNYDVIFQEKFSESSLLKNLKNPGPIISFNKQPLAKIKIKLEERRAYKFARIEDFGTFDFSRNNLDNLFLHPLTKMNLINIHDRSNYPDKPYLNIDCYYFYTDIDGCEINSKFEALMIALDAIHGLSIEDRRFYYNDMYDRFEPIYYNGNSSILDSDNQLTHSEFTDEQILGAKLLLQNFNYITEKKAKIIFQNLDLNPTNKIKLLNKIKSNLETISRGKHIKKNNFDKKYFSNLKENFGEMNFQLIVGNSLNNLSSCDFDFKKCEKLKIGLNKFKKIIKNQISNYKDKNVVFLSNNQKKFFGNENFNNSFLNLPFYDDDKIKFFYSKGIEFSVKKNQIDFIQNKKSGKVVFYKTNLDNLKINFRSIVIKGKVENEPYDLDGCINFIESKISKIDFNISLNKNSHCNDAIHFENTNGDINIISVYNTPKDAIDSDFSNIYFNEIRVDKTGQGGDCIGLKSGEYYVYKAILTGCFDTGISSGENGNLKVDNAEIADSGIGLVSKDSSILEIKNIKIKDTENCFIAYRKSIYFSGSEIKTNNLKCTGSKYFVQKGSRWIN